MELSRWRYALVTSAHNEARHIRKTIQSVVAQSVQPVRWVIVSDRSTDETDKIVQEYSDRYGFISYVRKTAGEGRDLANKVYAIQLALENLRDTQYDFIGNLDADIAFRPGYFQFLLNKFEEDSSLGIVGGRIHVFRNGKLNSRRSNLESVPGAVQFFRRECYETIGGYEPLRSGFIDGLAEISARMHGWTTRSFPEQTVVHFGEVGTAGRSILRFRFNSGVNEFRLGYSYLYHLTRSVYYLTSRPVLIGTLFTMAGYVWACATRQSRVLRPEVVSYMRKEQHKRMLDNMRRMLHVGAEKVDP